MAANGFCWGIAGLAANWNAGAAATGRAAFPAVCPTLDPAVKLKLGAEFAENENGLAVLSLLLLLLLLDPNWKGAAAGALFAVADPEPNSNNFFAWGSSPVGAEAAPDAPNGLLAPNAGVATPNTGAVVEALEALPKAGAVAPAAVDC